jgi:hypothetical protein
MTATESLPVEFVTVHFSPEYLVCHVIGANPVGNALFTSSIDIQWIHEE